MRYVQSLKILYLLFALCVYTRKLINIFPAAHSAFKKGSKIKQSEQFPHSNINKR